MTSIQLPPLSFDDGGFRVSIITGPSTAQRSVTTNPSPFADPEPELKFQVDAEAQSNSGTSTQEQISASTRENSPGPRASEEDRADVEAARVELGAEPRASLQPDLAQAGELQSKSEQRTLPGFKPSPIIDSTSELVSETKTYPTFGSLEEDPPVFLRPGHHNDHATDMPEREQSPSPPSNVPSHPIESLQAAFVESLDEVTKGGPNKPKIRELDARARRERLLEQEKDEEPFDALWRYRPGQTQHEVLKLISQISFGVYLLLNGMANDNSQVISILQGHIDEVDEFLEVTLEDFDEAARDLKERIEYLELPMSNMTIFEEMLEDRHYRAEILEGNEKLEHVVGRMAVAIRQWDDDIDAGLQGTTAFNDWLNSVKSGAWRFEQPDLAEIFDAMKGNADGWINAFDEMNTKTREMSSQITKITATTAEMELKAGEVSRKTWSTIAPYSSPPVGSMKSRKTSISSPPRSTTQGSIRSASIVSIVQQVHPEEGESDDDLGEFPLPGNMPFLPPTRFSVRKPNRRPSAESHKLYVDTDPKPPTVVEVPEEEREDSPLYLLQPRTYTPQLPAPVPSPIVREPAREPVQESFNAPTSSPRMRPESGDAPISIDARSVHDRVSSPRVSSPRTSDPRMSNPRVSNSRVSNPRVSSPRMGSPRFTSSREDLRMSGHDARNIPTGRVTPGYQTPVMGQTRRSNQSHLHLAVRDSSTSSNLQARDSAGSGYFQVRDSSGSEMDGHYQNRMPRVGSHAELRSTRPMVHSTSSEFQHYHPVLASPHSPLQQRPHTAAGPQSYRPPSSHPAMPGRPQPSRLGSMATVNTVAVNADDRQSTRTAARSVGGQTLKKKKSAFGWFKKAFTMDDEERAAFEARKQMQQSDNYYKGKDPKFIDGRRVR